MSKERRQVTLDEEVIEEIPEEISFSGKVNSWATQYFVQKRTHPVEAAMVQDMRDALNQLRDELHEAVDEAIDAAQESLDESVEHLEGVSR